MTLKKLSKNKSYPYSTIEEYANKNGFEIKEVGDFLIGENFLILRHELCDQVISFVMDAYNQAAGAYYKVIYSDF